MSQPEKTTIKIDAEVRVSSIDKFETPSYRMYVVSPEEYKHQPGDSSKRIINIPCNKEHTREDYENLARVLYKIFNINAECILSR